MLVSVVNDEAQIKHALPDMVVFRAGYGLHVGFDGNFLRERAVRRTFGALVTLPGPVLHVDSGVLPGPDLRAEFFVELVGEALGTRNLHVALDNFRVPDLVQIRRVAFRFGVARGERRPVATASPREPVASL